MTSATDWLSKAELLEAIRASGRDVVATVHALPKQAFERGRYEHGWNAHELLCHLAGIEWVYALYVGLARLGTPLGGEEAVAPVRRTQPHEGPDVATLSAEGGIDGFNAREVAKRAEASVQQLLEEFERHRAALIDAVERADEALLRTPVRSIGSITGILGGVLYRVAVEHVREHIADMQAAAAV